MKSSCTSKRIRLEKNLWIKSPPIPKLFFTIFIVTVWSTYMARFWFLPYPTYAISCCMNSTPYFGRPLRFNCTFKRLSTSFSWLGLKKYVTTFVKHCEVCQAIKTPTHRPYGLLQPLPISHSTWHDISMDFITNLPSSKGKTNIWFIVDRHSKFSHFISLPTHYT